MTEIANAASALVFRQTVVPILFQVVTQVKPQRLGIFAHRLELVPPKAVTLSGREQKENGGSSKGEKYFGCGNCPLMLIRLVDKFDFLGFTANLPRRIVCG